MAPTLVAAAVGALFAAALLGPAFDRRSVAVVLLAAVLPDLDAAVSLLVHGGTNAVLHTLLVPAVAVGLLAWDARWRERSALRDRYGWRGVRVAWVGIGAYVVAGIGLDLFGAGGVNVLYPLHDRFYEIDGRLLLSSRDGLVQSYVGFGGDGAVPLASPGTTADHHVASWVNPTPGTGVETGVERRVTLVASGWQAVLVATGAALLAIRSRGVTR